MNITQQMIIKILVKSYLMIICLFSVVSANANIIPEPFRGQDNDSIISINYEDYNQILNICVLDMGLSKRAKAPRIIPAIGSRIKAKRKSIYTALEGNRFLFKNFKHGKNKLILTTIRKSLEKVPDEVLMSQLTSDEQLAYWLNLYNISLIEQLVAIYPKKNLGKTLYSKTGIMKNKFLTVSGVNLSLNDIHEKIIFGKFHENPLVIYGLFQGVIGGPNIRTTAYTGENVFKQLRQNAVEFINSNRGMYFDNKGRMKVSHYYEINRQFFPDFKTDLKKHMSPYVNDEYFEFFENSTQIKATIKDMGIVDINGGQRRVSSSASTNQAAFLGSAAATGVDENLIAGPIDGFIDPSTGIKSEAYRSLAVDFGRYSPQEMEVLIALKEQQKLKSGEVIIEESSDDKSQ